MTDYLLIDFGTTSTKSALVNLENGAFSHLQRHRSIPRDSDVSAGRHQVPLDAIYQRFDEICRGQWPLASPSGYAGIVICSEMHGFAVLDEGGSPLSPYVSWLDARSLEIVDGHSTYETLAQTLGPRFRRITGMKPRSGFPLMNLTHLASERDDFPDRGLVVSLPGWLAIAADRARGSAFAGPPAEHPTLLAGLALYDVHTSRASSELAGVVRDMCGFAPILGESATESTVVGHWQGAGAAVPIYVGVGDHQRSVLGSALAPEIAANLNLGTGSQLSVIDRPLEGADVEIRPYFNDRQLNAVTHIPAGRALAEYVGFLADVAGSGADRFWERLAAITEAECQASTLDFDLSVFEGARNFSGGGRIAGVLEGELSLHNYLASLLRAFVEQYVDVIETFAGDGGLDRCVLSGGIARNLPNLAGMLASRCADAGLELDVAPAADLDESLLGLRSLALLAHGLAADFLQAQQTFDRPSRIDWSNS